MRSHYLKDKNTHMKKVYYLRLILGFAFLLMCSGQILAGNPDRAGQSGASELLLNPWARSSGWGGANSGAVRGLEAEFLNVAGTAFTTNTEIGFCHTIFLKGTGITVNALGLSKKVGEAGVLSGTICAMSFGDIPVTTVDQPEPSLGNFSPQFLNLAISYAKIFSHSIYGGATLRIIDENISNVGAQGIALDAGIQYVTGSNADKDNFRFGIALKNVGTTMKFGGDGLSTRLLNSTGTYQLTVEQRTNGFEMPSLVNIGAMYIASLAIDHRLSFAANFTSNSFSNDQYSAGLEYGFKETLMLRGGFIYEKDLFDENNRSTWFTGPSAGFSLDFPLGKTGKKIGVDYAFRATKPFDGTHLLGAKIVL